MTTTLSKTSRVSISDQTVQEVQNVKITSNDSLLLNTADGKSIPLSPHIKDLILQALASIAHSGEVTIGRLPEELTSNTAADILGISRPTLMKWAKEKKVPSFKVGSHTRFRREDILHLQSERTKERKEAFNRLRSFEQENTDIADV